MNRALVLYHSRRGTTAQYGGEIAAILSQAGMETTLMPMYQAAESPVKEADIIFIGCWTSGLMFFGQKPEKIWIEYVRQLPDIGNKEIVLFTTYKVLTGSMFREMAKHLPHGSRISMVKLKSRSGRLTSANKQLLQLLTNTYPVAEVRHFDPFYNMQPAAL
jgi:flavodoxin